MEKPKAWNRGVFSLTTNQFLPNRFLQNLQDQTMQMWELAVSLANLCEEKKSHQYRTLKSLGHPVCPTDFITFLPEKQHLSQAAEQGRSYTWMAVIGTWFTAKDFNSPCIEKRVTWWHVVYSTCCLFFFICGHPELYDNTCTLTKTSHLLPVWIIELAIFSLLEGNLM